MGVDNASFNRIRENILKDLTDERDFLLHRVGLLERRLMQHHDDFVTDPHECPVCGYVLDSSTGRV